jgi:hypothetical protein
MVDAARLQQVEGVEEQVEGVEEDPTAFASGRMRR